jgi:hypothetical protein
MQFLERARIAAYSFLSPMVLVCAAFFVVMEYVNLRFVVIAYSPVPFFDQWDNVLPDQLLPRLFLHHNEHRIVIPRLVFIADTFLGGGRQTIAIAATHLLIIVNGCIFGFVAGRLIERGFRMQIALSFFFSGLFLTFYVRELIEWGFLVQWPIVYAFAFAAYLALFPESGRTRWWVAFLSGLLASLSMANGALVFVPVAVISAFLRDKRLLLFAIVGTTILVIFQLIGLPSSPLPEFAGSAGERIAASIHFGLVLVGAPFTALLEFVGRVSDATGTSLVPPNLVSATLVGGLFVCLFTVLVIRLYVRETISAAHLFFIATGWLVLVSAAITAWTRCPLGLVVATAPRYGIAALFFSAATLALALDYLVDRLRESQPGRSKAMVATVLGATMLLFLDFQVQAPWRDVETASGRKLAETALLAHVDDENALKQVYPPWKEHLEGIIRRLRVAHLSVFSEPWSDWFGRETPLPIAPQTECSGYLEAVERVAEGDTNAYRVRGWVDYHGHNLAAARVLLVDSSNVVVGYGLSGWPRLDVPVALPEVRSSYSGWWGHVNASAVMPIRAYVLLDGNRACPLSSIQDRL